MFGSAGIFALINSSFMTKTPDSFLPNSGAFSDLSTGYLKNTHDSVDPVSVSDTIPQTDVDGLVSALAAKQTASTLLSRLGAAPVTLVDGATVAINAALGCVFDLSAADPSATTLLEPTNPLDGQPMLWRLHNANVADKQFVPGNRYRFNADFTSLTDTTAGKSDHIGWRYCLADNFWDIEAYTKGY